MGLDADLETTVKLYPFPKPQPHLRQPSDWPPLQPLPRIYWDHSTHVIRWMGRNALRRLAVYWDAEMPLPSVDELAAWIEDHSRKADDYFKPSKLSRMHFDAAAFALEAWDPEVLLQRRRWAHNGGLRTAALRRKNPSMPTRGPEFTVAMLETLEPGLSIAKQAKALGCSTATVSRLRAAQKATKAQEVEAELEALMPSQAPATASREHLVEPGPFDYLLEGGDVASTVIHETNGWPPNTTADLPDGWTEGSWEDRWEILYRSFRAEQTQFSDLLADMEL